MERRVNQHDDGIEANYPPSSGYNCFHAVIINGQNPRSYSGRDYIAPA